MMNGDGMAGFFVFSAIIVGAIGWGTIEFLLWLLSFVSVSFG